jgi:hypothetical protein
MRSMPRLYKEEQLRLRESFVTAVRRVRGSCETVAGQYGREYGSCGSYGVGSHYQATTGEDRAH